MTTVDPTSDAESLHRHDSLRGGMVGAPSPDTSLSDLFSRLTGDVSELLRKEIELAKLEIKEEGSKAGKTAAMLGGTGLAALFALLLLSFAAAWGLAEVVAPGWAFLIVGGVYLLLAGALFIRGREQLRQLRPVPEKTVATLKEDVQWAKHPTQ